MTTLSNLTGGVIQPPTPNTIAFSGGMLEAMPKVFMGMKRKLIHDVVRLVKPHLRDSGYRKVLDPKRGILGPTRSLKIWVPGRGHNPYRLKGGYSINEFCAITEDGVITDAHGHGAVTIAWTDLPIEDLYRLREWIKRRLAKTKGVA